MFHNSNILVEYYYCITTLSRLLRFWLRMSLNRLVLRLDTIGTVLFCHAKTQIQYFKKFYGVKARF